MILPARAKINLTLEVLGKRADGYHEIRSVMRTLTLHDTIQLEPADDLVLECDVPGLGGERNLAYQAALLLQEATGCRRGAHIRIAKAIPVAGGLGGGSSDAAATLCGLNDLWATGQNRQELAHIAARLGSDVPFFLQGGTALAAGRGEQIRALPDPANCTVLLVRPPIAVSTTAIYAAVTQDAYTGGVLSERFAALPPATMPTAWPLINALQQVTCEKYPVVGEVLALLQSTPTQGCLMSGSGPTCFALFADEEGAVRTMDQLQARGWETLIARFA